MRALQSPRNGSNSGVPMIGSSSIFSSVARTVARSVAESAAQSLSSDSTMRSRSFHKEILRQHQRVPAHFVLGRIDPRAQVCVVSDLDRLPKRQVFVV